VLPGPNVVNLSLMMGSRYFGWRGALAAAGGLLSIPLVIILILGMLYAEFSGYPGVVGATRGVSAVAAGLIIATGFKMFAGLKANPLGKITCSVLCLVCFIGIAWLRLPLWAVLLTLGPLACFLAYRAMKE
jgi:chromate transporter